MCFDLKVHNQNNKAKKSTLNSDQNTRAKLQQIAHPVGEVADFSCPFPDKRAFKFER